MKICLVTYANNYFRYILKNPFEISKILFCNNNNIDFKFEQITKTYNFKLSWFKLKLILKYFKLNYDVVIITDYDSVIINQNYDIHSLLNIKTDIICNQLPNGFKLIGCSIWYNTPQSNRILNNLIHSNYNNIFLAEEKQFNDLLPNFNIDILIEENINCINSVHNNKNPFIMHYANVGNPYKIKLLHNTIYNK